MIFHSNGSCVYKNEDEISHPHFFLFTLFIVDETFYLLMFGSSSP